MKNTARQIAVRTFLSNVNGMEDEAYEFMQDCDRPDETYADDYFNDKPYRIWNKFELDTVGKVLDMIDDLANDIEQSYNPKPLTIITPEDWNIDKENQYIYITNTKLPGSIIIKADDEGYVFDVYPDSESEEPYGTMAIMYNELEEE